MRFAAGVSASAGKSRHGAVECAEINNNLQEKLAARQLAITNARQHTRASRIQLELQFDKHALQSFVAHDGRAIVPSAVNDGFGLHAMRGPISKIGEKFKLASKPGNAPQIEVNVPVAYQADTLT